MGDEYRPLFLFAPVTIVSIMPKPALDQEAHMYKKILVPLDGSEVAEAALPLVCNLADINGAEIVLLRVVEYPSEVYAVSNPYFPNDPHSEKMIQEKKHEYLAAAEEYLELVAAPLKKNHFTVTSEVWEGPVVEAIQHASAAVSADLIVMSSHGRSTGSLCGIIGSVANRVLNNSKIPVILASNPLTVAA
jgi:nucleotide-binding universal stress UspA family protein